LTVRTIVMAMVIAGLGLVGSGRIVGAQDEGGPIVVCVGGGDGEIDPVALTEQEFADYAASLHESGSEPSFPDENGVCFQPTPQFYVCSFDPPTGAYFPTGFWTEERALEYLNEAVGSFGPLDVNDGASAVPLCDQGPPENIAGDVPGDDAEFNPEGDGAAADMPADQTTAVEDMNAGASDDAAAVSGDAVNAGSSDDTVQAAPVTSGVSTNQTSGTAGRITLPNTGAGVTAERATPSLLWLAARVGLLGLFACWRGHRV
jgi:hypothetical protein